MLEPLRRLLRLRGGARRAQAVRDPPMPVAAFDPARHRSAAAHYRSGRPDYAPALIARIAASAGLGRPDRLLDLGSGPGILALALAPFAGEVVAMDPEPEMLAGAAAAAAEAGVRLTLLEGSSYDLTPALGPFRLVAIGRAFHLMDRAATLAALNRIVEPGGAVVLVGATTPKSPENAWQADFEAVRRRYWAAAGRQGPSTLSWKQHESALRDSPFRAIERLVVAERRRTPVDRFVERALSMASTSPHRLGDATAAFAEDIRRAVEPHARDGLVAELVESRALLARRPLDALKP
jgi:SAM-dependent methyltransferase